VSTAIAIVIAIAIAIAKDKNDKKCRPSQRQKDQVLYPQYAAGLRFHLRNCTRHESEYSIMSAKDVTTPDQGGFHSTVLVVN
jgi:co-chaperonin GroES (HSP10)